VKLLGFLRIIFERQGPENIYNSVDVPLSKALNPNCSCKLLWIGVFAKLLKCRRGGFSLNLILTYSEWVCFGLWPSGHCLPLGETSNEIFNGALYHLAEIKHISIKTLLPECE
jgi:hypothetical protein